MKKCSCDSLPDTNTKPHAHMQKTALILIIYGHIKKAKGGKVMHTDAD